MEEEAEPRVRYYIFMEIQRYYEHSPAELFTGTGRLMLLVRVRCTRIHIYNITYYLLILFNEKYESRAK